MNQFEFQNSAITELQERFPDSEISPVEVTKLQGQSYQGVSIRPTGKDAAVTLDLRPFNEKTEKGVSMEQAIEELTRTVQEAIDHFPEIDTGSLGTYEQVKDMLTLQLIPVTGNEQRLAEVPHKQVEDMALVYRIDVPIGDQNSGSILIDQKLMEKYGITENQLEVDALKAAVKNSPAIVRNMTEVMQEIMGENRDIVPAEESPLWVASVRGGQNGACVIQYPGFLEEAAKKLEGNFYVLPSSIHEVLLVKNDGCMKLADLEDMVKSINQTEVAPADRLSDHVYHYDSKEKIFENARTFEARQKQKEATKQKAKAKKCSHDEEDIDWPESGSIQHRHCKDGSQGVRKIRQTVWD